jgi:hypothetical protein
VTRRRSEILKIVDGVQPMVDQFNELSDEDQRVFLDMVDPLPDEVEPPAPKKRTRKKAGKSRRAASLAGQIGATPKVDSSAFICAHRDEGGNHCMEPESSGIHDPAMGYRNHHDYEHSHTESTLAKTATGD